MRGGWLRRLTPLRRKGKRRQSREAALLVFRGMVYRRAGYRCERCGRDSHIEAHHILPVARGGEDNLANGACLCGGLFGCRGQVHDHITPHWRDWIASDEDDARDIRKRLDRYLGIL